MTDEMPKVLTESIQGETAVYSTGFQMIIKELERQKGKPLSGDEIVTVEKWYAEQTSQPIYGDQK